MSAFSELKWRGLVFDSTPEAEMSLEGEQLTVYIGFDPTAASLHVGSLVPVMGLARLQRYGHRPIALVGGGTGLIGDPSGKKDERKLLSREQVGENLTGIRRQLERFLHFDDTAGAGSAAVIVDNAEWLDSLSFIDFLRDTGKRFTVNYMLAKESVKRRLESEDGLSFTEFSYMLLQSYDFLELFKRYNCTMQLGGSDQWGNIVAGSELVRKVSGERVHGLVFPLITNSSGTKFGKTETGTIWLDPERTSPFKFYQFWINTEDADVIRYLKYFTWLDEQEINDLQVEVDEQPGQRVAQEKLAEEVTRIVHGEAGLERAKRATQVLFATSFDDLELRDIMDVFSDAPSSQLPRKQFEQGMSIVDLAAASGLTASKGEARRLIRSGGLRVNNQQMKDEGASIDVSDAIGGKLIVLRKGKKSYQLVELE